MASAMQTCY
ncbi:hypothetical protein DDE82_008981 [Stemphylium lycopersici]|uniref:Uncharacterized protein n=1 Tax=Stemphylium lycopersici TaxID=183478 RepID=A0A364MRE6_STELY|nr:hypothetical protein TW65_05782 [Stemphylium lycopersici]RAQ98713.1 hypothetical protein DDE82_008981 [Stemphylium lycopersici]RAQ99861.1 hypothetical protein DDE83_009171 [Stemphylium lycopersici]